MKTSSSKTNKDRGYFKLYRSFFSNEFWTMKRELSPAEAWLYLMSHARFDKDPIFQPEADDFVKRGEIYASLSYLQTAWMWNSRTKVMRFLEKLVELKMIKRRGSILVICNYEYYNDVDNLLITEGESSKSVTANVTASVTANVTDNALLNNKLDNRSVTPDVTPTVTANVTNKIKNKESLIKTTGAAAEIVDNSVNNKDKKIRAIFLETWGFMILDGYPMKLCTDLIKEFGETILREAAQESFKHGKRANFAYVAGVCKGIQKRNIIAGIKDREERLAAIKKTELEWKPDSETAGIFRKLLDELDNKNKAVIKRDNSDKKKIADKFRDQVEKGLIK